MGLFNWGALPKAQDDPQTINEAIIEAIATHESDPTAHLGAGESLEQHKSNEILDHPEFSAVPDKFSQNGFVINTNFETIASWVKSGNVVSGFGKLIVKVLGNAGADSSIYTERINFSLADDYTILDNLFETDFYFAESYHVADAIFGLGVAGSWTPDPYFIGFKIVSNVLYSGYANGGAVTWVSHGSLSGKPRQYVRVMSSKEFQEIYFYINNVLVRTVAFTGDENTLFSWWGIYLDKVGGTTSSQYSQISFSNLRWALGAY